MTKKTIASKKPRMIEKEKGKIEDYHEVGVGTNAIVRMTGRCAQTVRRVLSPTSSVPSKPLGPPRIMSERDVRHLVRAAAGQQVSASKLKVDLNLAASVRTTQHTLANVNWLEYAKMVNTLPLKPEDKLARMAWAKAMMLRKDVRSVWGRVIFSDEKKWNLDGPDGYQHYWRGLRQPPRTTKRRQAGGGSVMAWAAFSARDKSPLVVLIGTQNSEDYVYTVSAYMLLFAHYCHGPDYIYQQDNTSIHVSNRSLKFFSEVKIELLDWPAM